MSKSNLVTPDYKECAVASTTERISPRKLNLVAATIRGMDAQRAMDHLGFMKVRGAPIIKKVIRSAMANASHNKGVDAPTVILRAEVGCKSILRRFRPGNRAATPICRRYSHVRIVLGVKGGE